MGKLKNKKLNTVDKIAAKIFGTEMTDTEFWNRIRNSAYKFENLEELQKHFCERKEPKFLIDSLKWKHAGSFIYEQFADAPDKIIAEADKICEHIFDLLGSGPVKVYYGMEAKGFKDHCYDMHISGEKLTTINNLPFRIINQLIGTWILNLTLVGVPRYTIR